ncbi:unnamed protein product [Linum tenue]|uniref:Uncharacterized protein n=1 Tax=Linum tenue TaxID=586396 RepID=A0AAV0I4M4_9ROSI|nr:unnamed protein product [Linum tenue]
MVRILHGTSDDRVNIFLQIIDYILFRSAAAKQSQTKPFILALMDAFCSPCSRSTSTISGSKGHKRRRRMRMVAKVSGVSPLGNGQSYRSGFRVTTSMEPVVDDGGVGPLTKTSKKSRVQESPAGFL